MVDLNKPVCDINDQPHDKVTLASVCIEALLATFPDEVNLPGTKKVERFILAQRIKTNPEVDLTSEETSLLKDLVGKGFAATVVGRVWSALDPASVK